jgi:hypothetical protein
MLFFMSKTEPEVHLTSQERSVIELTISAVTGLLNKEMSISPKERAIKHCKPHIQSTKSTARTSLLFNIVDGNHELPARREHIIERLPGELSKIDKSDAYDILQSLVRLHFLENEKKIVRARGRPKGLGYKDDNRGGRPSYYDKSSELKESAEILKKPNIRRLINNRLIETGVLPKYLKYRNLELYYLIRMDENAYWRAVEPFQFVKEVRTNKSKEIELFFNKVRSLGENELQEEAEKIAQATLRRNYDNVGFFINVIAGAWAKASAQLQ